MLSRVIYLNPAHYLGYLELGAVYDYQGKFDQARTMRKSALNILRGVSPEKRIEPYRGITVKDLLDHLEKQCGLP
ncbi:MAG: hypothetical protein COV67_02690 [Nitrospinae bacterium CG11_big_fil_rev_8_21_14_0_20_56_8]|nr:MAG: hypothetical protein COV67_02690 [Nitrospinae bacterium CG11_big_fil_rev_8_21_14_0_20_56_8]